MDETSKGDILVSLSIREIANIMDPRDGCGLQEYNMFDLFPAQTPGLDSNVFARFSETVKDIVM